MPACGNCGYESDRAFTFCPRCGTESGAALPREQRKTVTVLFCDLTGSTALGETLDPERLRALLARYFDRMKAIVERHGGSVEKFIGDAVMAVFGVPALHEDDALRAVRAAAEMRDALPELGLQGRIGVTTGEVVTGTEERLATGDAVNVAARLESAAQPGEVLIGQPTLALVRDAADVEPIEPLELKGKSDPVPAYRLLGVHEVPERAGRGLFVGRDRELAMLREAGERVRADERCELITVVGDAGVGKSRLTAEALASIDATVLRGRCPPYGEGITYWPVVEVLKQLHVLPPEPAAAEAVRSLLGQTEAATSADEIAWAFRKTLEHAAAERPLVVVFDDIQWGEEVFLDLIEHVALLSSGASVMLFCIARPELTERRPAWPVSLRLEPLADGDVDELIPERIIGELRDKIARASGGNPLFIEEMLAVARETDGQVVVPPTLQALLAARVDQLEAKERSVLERGAIEGEIFHRGAVQALAPEEAQVTSRLAALVRKELITPVAPLFSGDDGFRFRHILIRDAAYDALPKATRADLHERFASWLEEEGPSSSSWTSSAVTTSNRLAATAPISGGRRWHTGRRGETALNGRRVTCGAPARLRRRHEPARARVSLVPPDELDLALETELAEAQLWAGRADDALRRQFLAERAAATGDRVGEIYGRIGEVCSGSTRQEGGTEELAALIQQLALARVRRRRTGAVHRLLGARRGGVLALAGGRRRSKPRERASAHARQAGHVPTGGVGTLAAIATSGRPLRPTYSSGSTRMNRSGAGPVLPCLPRDDGGDARSGRRGPSDPRRSACGPGRTGRGNPAREPPRLRVCRPRALGR